jgi:hypothetical protein
MATLLKIHSDGFEEYKESGPMCNAVSWNEDGSFKGVVGHEPTIGCSLIVGSMTARSYSDSDYWMTTTITKIIEQTDEHWIFETENSTYKLLK